MYGTKPKRVYLRYHSPKYQQIPSQKKMHLFQKRQAFNFEISVRKVTVLGTSQPPSAPVSVVWSRGTQLATTCEKLIPRSGPSNGSTDFNETLHMVCTLFTSSDRDAVGAPTFLCKLATLKLCEGRRCVGKGKIDLALFASCTKEPKSLALNLIRSNKSVGLLAISISASAGSANDDGGGSESESVASEASTFASECSESDVANLADVESTDRVVTEGIEPSLLREEGGGRRGKSGDNSVASSNPFSEEFSEKNKGRR